MEPFSFEKLDVYQKAVRWVQTVDEICSRAKGRVSANTLDQFSRASLSVALNIAEGNGRWHTADKRQFFWIARGSVFECVPLLEVLKSREVLRQEDYEKCRESLSDLGKMLSGLIKAVEKMGASKNREISQGA